MKKGFEIDLDDALTYPTASKICETLEKYFIKSKENGEITSKENPVTFILDEHSYTVKVSLLWGGYVLSCKEI